MRTMQDDTSSRPLRAKHQAGRKVALGLVTLAAGTALPVAGGGAPAYAAVGACYHGIDSGTTNWAWGSCSGVTGSSHWRLHLGQHAVFVVVLRQRPGRCPVSVAGIGPRDPDRHQLLIRPGRVAARRTRLVPDAASGLRRHE
jgi:hypothetical protein